MKYNSINKISKKRITLRHLIIKILILILRRSRSSSRTAITVQILIVTRTMTIRRRNKLGVKVHQWAILGSRVDNDSEVQYQSRDAFGLSMYFELRMTLLLLRLGMFIWLRCTIGSFIVSRTYPYASA